MPCPCRSPTTWSMAPKLRRGQASLARTGFFKCSPGLFVWVRVLFLSAHNLLLWANWWSIQTWSCQYIIHWITLVFLDRGIAPLVWLGGINLAWPNLRFAGGRYDPTCRPGAPQNASHGCSQGFLITVSLSMGPFCLEVLGMKGKITKGVTLLHWKQAAVPLPTNTWSCRI